MSDTTNQRPRACAFCGLTENDVSLLFPSRDGRSYICDNCIELCSEFISTHINADEEEDEEEESEDEDDSTEDYSDWSTKDLKKECRTRGIKVTKSMGKAELVKALEADDKE